MSERSALNPLPISVLAELAERFGEFMIIGAHARDRIVHDLAGLALSRLTHDLDLAIAVPSMEAFHQATRGLKSMGDTGTRFLVQGQPVDVLPFGEVELAAGPILETAAGILTDVTGLAEAYQSADLIELKGVRFKAPTLPAMIVLKTVAWLMRGRETDKDATDLAMLLEAASHGQYEARCYDDLALLGRLDADPARVGTYLAGRDIAMELPTALPKCMNAWAGARHESLLHQMNDVHGTYRRALAAMVDGTRNPVTGAG